MITDKAGRAVCIVLAGFAATTSRIGTPAGLTLAPTGAGFAEVAGGFFPGCATANISKIREVVAVGVQPQKFADLVVWTVAIGHAGATDAATRVVTKIIVITITVMGAFLKAIVKIFLVIVLAAPGFATIIVGLATRQTITLVGVFCKRFV